MPRRSVSCSTSSSSTASRSAGPRPHCASTGASSRRSSGPSSGKIKLKALDACHLDTLYAKLSKRGLKATSVRRVHALMSAALAQADKWEMVDRNVGRKATPPPVHDAEIGAPSPETVNALIYAAEASSEPMMATLLFLGRPDWRTSR